MLPPEFGQKAPGGLALAILFIGTVLLDDHLRTERNHLPPFGMHDGSPQHLLVILLLPVALALLEAVG